MPSSLEKESKAPSRVSRPDLLRRFLQSYWLRPENAFWMTLRSETLANCPIEQPALDIACGDGLFSFLHCGGVLDPSFDVFHAVSENADAPRLTHDMFDCCDDEYRPNVVALPQTRFTLGLDLKPALLAKAAKLDFYDVLVRHDCNQPLPFDDHVFKTIYCNAAYWIDNIAGFLDELHRITQPGGRIILQVKLDTMARYTLAAHHNQLGPRVLEIIGRDRLDCWQSLADRRTWEERFAKAGLHVDRETPFITATHAHIWDIGLRPVAPMLIKLANGVTAQTRDAVKTEWVDLFMDLATPLCDAHLNLFGRESEPAEIQYELRPQ